MKLPKKLKWIEGEKYDHPEGFPIICPHSYRTKAKLKKGECNFLDSLPSINEDYNWVICDFAELPLRTQNHLINKYL